MTPAKRNRPDYIIQSVDHALEVLDAFQNKEDELGITELSRRLKLHKNNVFRILATLENRGYVEQNTKNDNYRLGLKTLELSRSYIRHAGLLRAARPVMEDLNERINENISIGILRDREVFYLDVVESTHTVNVIFRVGCRIPAYCSAIGKVQLAYESMENLLDILREKKLKRFTPNTITDRDEVLKHLAEVRKKGYAIDNEEMDEGVRCLGAPVFDGARKAVAAGLSISAPSVRMSMKKAEKEFLPLIEKASEEISARLGFAKKTEVDAD